MANPTNRPHAVAWDRAHPRAFNIKDHPSLLTATGPRFVTASHALAAKSPALVGVYPATNAGSPYELVYVPEDSDIVKSALVKPGFYVVAVPGEEFVVRVSGRGGFDHLCSVSGSPLVLVNVFVDGKCTNEPTVLQRGFGDVDDEVFHGFNIQSAPGKESKYKRFVFAKTPVVEAGEDTVPNSVNHREGELVEGGSSFDIGALDVKFATAAAIPRDDSPVNSDLKASSGVRLSQAPTELRKVSEQAAAKHGVSVGVGAGAEAVDRRPYTSSGVYYNEELKDFNVRIFMRERWWMEAKGLMPRKNGRWVKDEVGDVQITLQADTSGVTGNEPAKKKAKVEVVNLDGDNSGKKNTASGVDEGDDD